MLLGFLDSVWCIFSKVNGNPEKNKIVAYLATHNAKGLSGNTQENLEDEECYNFIILKCPTNKEFQISCSLLQIK